MCGGLPGKRWRSGWPPPDERNADHHAEPRYRVAGVSAITGDAASLGKSRSVQQRGWLAGSTCSDNIFNMTVGSAYAI